MNNATTGTPAVLTLSGGINGGGYNLTVNDSITTTAGKVVLGNSTGGEITNIGTLTVAAGTVQFAALTGRTAGSANNLVVLGGLSVSGILDVTNRDMLVHNESLSAVQSLIYSGWGSSGHWSGTTGLITSEPGMALGYMSGAEWIGYYGAGAKFDGQTVSAGDALVKYTYFGDSNFDGQSNLADFALFQNNFNGTSGPYDWFQGDWAYDGQVDLAGFANFQNNFNGSSGGPLAVGIDGLGGSVPEPASLGLLAVAALGLLGRRRGTR